MSCQCRSFTVLKHSKVEIELMVNCSYVTRLEHVQAKINLTSNKRGDLEVRLVSPAGTVSILLDVRPMDNSRMGFTDWPFMTVHNWGENANGVWKLVVINRGFGNTSKYLQTSFNIFNRINILFYQMQHLLGGNWYFMALVRTTAKTPRSTMNTRTPIKTRPLMQTQNYQQTCTVNQRIMTES